MTKVNWKCGYCNSIQTSDSEETHKMDYCKCKKSFMDKEEYYYRTGGKIIILKKVDGKGNEEEFRET